jgi:hypothetical protein
LAMTLGSQFTTPTFFSLDAHAAALLAKHSRQFLPKKFFSPQNLDFDLENPQVRPAGCRNLRNATALTFPSVDAHAAALLAKHSRQFLPKKIFSPQNLDFDLGKKKKKITSKAKIWAKNHNHRFSPSGCSRNVSASNMTGPPG